MQQGEFEPVCMCSNTAVDVAVTELPRNISVLMHRGTEEKIVKAAICWLYSYSESEWDFMSEYRVRAWVYGNVNLQILWWERTVGGVNI